MKFRQYGYTEKKVEVRTMTMGAIALTIAQGLIKRDALDNFLSKAADWGVNWEVNVYDWGVMHDNKADKDYLKVIIADESEMV